MGKLVLFVAALWVWAISAQAEESLPLLQTRGEAVLEVPADQATLQLGVVNVGRDADAAMAESGRLSERVVKALHRAGVPQGALTTRALAVQPQWSPRPRDAGADWQAQIVGYRVSNQIRLVTEQLTRLPLWIQAAVEAGANEVGQLQFSLADADGHYLQALQLATRKARQQADSVADAAGVGLGALYQLQVESQSPRPLSGVRLEAMTMRAAGAAPVIEAGDIEVRAAVVVRYRIQP
ncbi:SIMPL domain-containing protein [Motiliproteus sediminis]|uniref:SIMPL domain-containing protein n=1 Tax=Motiliproteus sediminis TaxID=1468178 RepID=UPI001AEFD077|nr:SIMPL domain-containing protein [Motiliproteus sediminis]